MSNAILEELESKKHNYLFEQYVDSICLKGITNSYDPQQKVTLDKKYYEFCTELVTRLYEGQEDEADDLDYRLYDILGDDDFRLIARDVKLGIYNYGVDKQCRVPIRSLEEIKKELGITL